MKPNIGISPKNLKGVIDILTETLATQVTLYTKLRKFHWNVYGESFMEYHLLFEAQYKELEEAIDEVAERITKLGGTVIGTTTEFQKHSVIKENPGKYPTSHEMVKELLEDHETAVRSLREGVDKCDDEFKDKGTADFLTDLMKAHETMAWKLRRYFK
jgi:starvation-inducible DNA-binding protein